MGAMVSASLGIAKGSCSSMGAHPSPVYTRSLQGHAAGDHADMAEGLRKIADETAGGRVDLLRQQSKLTRSTAQRFVQAGRLVEFALLGQILDEPEAAQDEGALVAGNSIRRLRVEITVEESIARGQSL